MENKQFIISIGREFGSAGHEIAQDLSKIYALPLYDHNLLKAVAEERNLNAATLEEFDEVHRNKLLTRTVRGMNSSPSHNVANLQFDFLRRKAEAGESFVVVGRCSETILKDYPCLISIFIMGDMDHKIERVKALYNKTDREAERFIKEKDSKRKKYHDSNCDTKWGESHGYHLSINSSHLGLEGSVKFLKEYIDARIEQMN